jgi:putative tricarboxylic transport membrane protein
VLHAVPNGKSLTRFFRQFLRPSLIARLPVLLLILTGLIAGGIAFGYEVGSFTDMGPGFVPLMLSIALVLLAALILWREWPMIQARAGGEAAGHDFAWRPFCAVSGGILAWVLLAESTGFFIAAIAQVVLAALALPGPRWRSILIMAGILAVAGYFLFVVQLGVPLEAVG